MGTLATREEVAEFLSVSPRTISRYVEQRDLPAIRLPSGTLRFDMGDVARWARRTEASRWTPDQARELVEGLMLGGATPEYIADRLNALGIERPTDVGYLWKED